MSGQSSPFDKENRHNMTNTRPKRGSSFRFSSSSTSSSARKRTGVLKRILSRRGSDPVPAYKRNLADSEDPEGLGSNLLSSFSRSSEEPLHNNFKKSETILHTFTNPDTGDHMGYLKEVMPPKQIGMSPRITLHQRNVWDDGWLMEVHYTFKNYTQQQVTVAIKFVHLHDNLEFLRYGDEPIKVQADKRNVFNVFALEGDTEQLVVKRKQRTGNPKMMEMSYRFGYRQNGRWKMTF